MNIEVGPEGETGLCEQCNQNIGDWCIEPYGREIAGQDYWMYLCDDCYSSNVQDI